jgi:hypothetical protein
MGILEHRRPEDLHKPAFSQVVAVSGRRTINGAGSGGHSLSFPRATQRRMQRER